MASTQLLLVMLVAIALSIFAERHRLQAPLVLVFVGLLVSFVPGVEAPELTPETILGIVVPPLLYSAALDFSFFSFMRRVGSILNLSVLLVVVTAAAVAAATQWLLPTLGLAATLILGAALSPPDAVSAVAIGRQLGLPRRVMTIMKGESLLNDAAALALFGVAAALASGRHERDSNVALVFLYEAIGGGALGVALGMLVDAIRRRLDDPALVTTLSVLVPFTAYALAEALDMSGVLAVVFAGFTLSHRSSDLGFAGRIQEREVWSVIDAVLETFAFAYMGLQLRTLVVNARADGFDLRQLLLAAVMLLAVVISVRIGWIALTAWLARKRHRALQRHGRKQPRKRRLAEPLSWRENLVLSWSGMRGVVTLAAAAATPLLTVHGQPVQGRSAIMLVAFGVAVATLLLQGMTLPWLVRALQLPSNDETLLRQQRQEARQVMRSAAKTKLADLRSGGLDSSELTAVERLLTKIDKAAAAADDSERQGMGAPDRAAFADITRQIHSAQREALVAERDALRLDDEVLREMLEGIDLEQAALAQRTGATE